LADDWQDAFRDDDVVAPADRPGDVTELIQAGRDREAAEQGAAGRTTRDGGSMDPITQLELLGPHLGGVVTGITPGQLGNPTPCADFTVRGVLEHMVAGATASAAAYRGEQSPVEPELADPLRSFGQVLGDLVAAITAPGALDRTIQAPFGELAGDAFARFVVLDGLVHGWDLATATGQPYEPPGELVAAAFACARETIDPLRDGDTFAAAIEPAAGASPIERLANYTGRR
jgi:uncharacterized protein (TIGR03086 family)